MSPPELWNRLGTKVLPKLRSVVSAGWQGSDLLVGIDISATVNHDVARSLAADLRLILDELGFTDKVYVRDA